MRAPVFVLAARDDALVALAQLFAAEPFIDTPSHNFRKWTVPSGHIGLFVGKTTIDGHWPGIERWIVGSKSSAAAAA
ncbi:MAG TPA: hypothetical protein VMT22_01775 [Terriglobales bacterium]|nr:hypothetical protein [Terriglobales bacterium]